MPKVTVTFECEDGDIALFLMALHAVYAKNGVVGLEDGLVVQALPEALGYLRDLLGDTVSVIGEEIYYCEGLCSWTGLEFEFMRRFIGTQLVKEANGNKKT